MKRTVRLLYKRCGIVKDNSLYVVMISKILMIVVKFKKLQQNKKDKIEIKRTANFHVFISNGLQIARIQK